MKFLIDHKLKIIIGWSAKCGCTHIKNIFEYFITGINKISSTIHSSVMQYDMKNFPRDIENYHVVIIVRNPFDRIVSGFLNKYRKTGTLRTKWPHDTITFSQFVDQIIHRNWSIIDHHHFCPQTEEYFNPVVFKSKTCKIFDLKSIDYSYIESIFKKKIPKNLIEYKGDHNRNKNIQTWATPVYDLDMDTYFDYNVNYSLFYNDDLKKKVYHFYINDFKLCQLINKSHVTYKKMTKLIYY